jgi:hypothetical protein
MNLFVFFMFFSITSAFNKYVFKSIDPFKLRKIISEDLNHEFKKLSWVRSKEILHNEVNSDIYGDNLHKKNVEHIFPQVYFKNDERKNVMKSDLHNLQLCSEKLNNYRQHFKFIDYDYIHRLDEEEKILDFKVINSNSDQIRELPDFLREKHDVVLINNKNKLFIPSLHSKGSIARSLAYFSIKYGLVDQLKNVIDYETLVRWNTYFPVNREETYKNIIGFKYHNKYNPFVNSPELINYCFSDLTEIKTSELHDETVESIIDNLVQESNTKKKVNNQILKALKK